MSEDVNLNQIHVLARAVIILDHHLLLAYDARPTPAHYYEPNEAFYYLPGGHIEFKEPAEAAVLREIYEETGYQATLERFLGLFEYSWELPREVSCCHTHELNLIFKLNLKGIATPLPIPQKEEHVAFNWISLDRIKEADLRPEKLKVLIPTWLENNDSGSFHSHMVKGK